MKLQWTLLSAAMALSAQEPAYLVLLKGASALGFYSSEGKSIATVPVGTHPHEMVLSPDKRYLYITDNGTMRIEHAGSGGNTISVIDLKQRQRTGTIDLGRFRRPHGIDRDAAGTLLAVTTELPDQLLLVDVAKRAVVKTFPTGGKTSHMVRLGPGARTAFVSNSSSANVSAVDLASGAVKQIAVGNRPEGSVLSRDGTLLFVCVREDAGIAILDTARQELTGRIATGKGPVRIDITPDGKTLVYAAMHDRAIEFADIATRKVIARVPVEGSPVSLHLSPDGTLAFASSEEMDLVHVVSVPGRKLLKSLRLAKGLAPDPVMQVPF